MRQVFISYGAADHEIGQRLAAELRQAGVKVWDPGTAILPGDNWALAVGKALEESEVMIPLVTKNTKDSSRLRDDVSYALTSGNYHGRVLPVIVNMPTYEAGRDVPWVLLRLQHFNVEGTSPDFEEIVEEVQKLAGATDVAPH